MEEKIEKKAVSMQFTGVFLRKLHLAHSEVEYLLLQGAYAAVWRRNPYLCIHWKSALNHPVEERETGRIVIVREPIHRNYLLFLDALVMIDAADVGGCTESLGEASCFELIFAFLHYR